MKIKHCNDVYEQLKKQYQVDRGGFFKVPGYSGRFSFTRASRSGDIEMAFGKENTPLITHNIVYHESVDINGKTVRISFHVDLNHKKNWWSFSEYIRGKKLTRKQMITKT